MNQVMMNTHIFDHIGPFKHVAPTLEWMIGKKEYRIMDLRVEYTLDYTTAVRVIKIINSVDGKTLYTSTRVLPCGQKGDQKNIDDVMGLIKTGLGDDRHAQVQTAANQVIEWFTGKISAWLKREALAVLDVEAPTSRDFCENIVYGIEVLK